MLADITRFVPFRMLAGLVQFWRFCGGCRCAAGQPRGVCGVAGHYAFRHRCRSQPRAPQLGRPAWPFSAPAWERGSPPDVACAERGSSPNVDTPTPPEPAPTRPPGAGPTAPIRLLLTPGRFPGMSVSVGAATLPTPIPAASIFGRPTPEGVGANRFCHPYGAPRLPAMRRGPGGYPGARGRGGGAGGEISAQAVAAGATRPTPTSNVAIITTEVGLIMSEISNR